MKNIIKVQKMSYSFSDKVDEVGDVLETEEGALLIVGIKTFCVWKESLDVHFIVQLLNQKSLHDTKRPEKSFEDKTIFALTRELSIKSWMSVDLGGLCFFNNIAYQIRNWLDIRIENEQLVVCFEAEPV